MTKKSEYDKLVAAHGTLQEFTEQVWESCDDGFVSVTEAVKSIRSYRSDLLDAARMDVATLEMNLDLVNGKKVMVPKGITVPDDEEI